jgi:Big-like domain-containing protein/carboxypeptidase family protein
MRSNQAALLLTVMVAAACAKDFPPPGGEPDRLPPRLVSTKPEQLAVVPQWKGEVVFTFDETLSEQGIRDAVMVSPETGRPTLNRDGKELKVRVEGGWKPNTVYRVILTPTIQDRFRNSRREPTELIFSTGPQLAPTAIAGIVSDRVTGRPVADARVVALSYPDSIPNATLTDTAGFFGLRFLVPGRYVVRAFEDRNRNKKADFAEKAAEDSVVLRTASDTTQVFLAMMAPDTTPARLLRAEARDSMQVRIVLDDFVDPEQPLTGASVKVVQLPDSTPVIAPRLMHVHAFEALRLSQQPRDTTNRPLPPAARPPADTVRRPLQELVVVPAIPLKPGTRYVVQVSGIVNLKGIPDGGGRVPFQMAAQRDPAATRRDTTGIRRDTVSRRP